MSCQVELCFPPCSPVSPPATPSPSFSSASPPGERCPDWSPGRRVPVRPARRLFKVADCCVCPSLPWSTPRLPPSPHHSKHEHVFHADQTPSHPRKANQSGTRRIIEALPQGNVRIRRGMCRCTRRTGGFSPPHQRRAAAKVIKLELILHII